MRVLVCGSREYDNWNYVFARLDELNEKLKFSTIIHGGAPGVDSLAGKWARRNNITEEEFKADWGKLGKAAGPIRNKQMLDEGKPELIVAFLSMDSKGTANMLKQSKVAGVNAIVYDI